MKGNTTLPAAALLAALAVGSAVASQGLPPQQGYVRQVSPEKATARADRRRRVRKRRNRTVIICRHGATAFAPENSLEACAAAMDYGADGCRVELRRTEDGVLIVFAPERLDGWTLLWDTAADWSYRDLLQFVPASAGAADPSEPRILTFAALLELARQRAMLLDLDVEQYGLDKEIASKLTAADVWDQVVAVNPIFAPELARDPRLRSFQYRLPALCEQRRDVDPLAVRQQVARPGGMVLVDDPRVAARALRRESGVRKPLPANLHETWYDDGKLTLKFLRRIAPTSLDNARTEEEHPGIEDLGSAVRARRIVARAASATSIGERRDRSPEIIDKLVQQVEHRMLHQEPAYSGLDGAMAVRALGELHAVEAAPTLVAAFRRVDPGLKMVADPLFPERPLGWADYQTKSRILPALGEMPCEVSKKFLAEYVSLDEGVAREMAPLQYAEATQALLKQKLSRAEIEALLRSRRPEVRGTAILECRDHPTRDRTAALREVVPWVLALPSASGGQDTNRQARNVPADWSCYLAPRSASAGRRYR